MTRAPSLKWLNAVWIIFWKSMTFFILWAILYSPFVVVLMPHLENESLSSPLLLRLFLDSTGALTVLIAAWLMVRFVDRRSFSTLGFASDHLVRAILLGVCIGFVWLAISIAILWLLGWVTLKPSGALDTTALAIAGLSMILNTVIQEVLARSYIFQMIRSQMNALGAVLISSLIFTLYHAAGLRGVWLPVFNLFCAGILFGVAYQVTGNLWLPIAIHFTWNFLLGPVLGLAVSGQDVANNWHILTLQGPAILTGGTFGMEGSLVVSVATMLGIAFLWRWYPRQAASITPDRLQFQETGTTP